MSTDGDCEFLNDSDQDDQQCVRPAGPPPLLTARYDFDYEDDEDDDPVANPDVENRYYNAKAIKDEEPRVALVEFFRIKSLPSARDGDW
jgi:hypothetical protein